MVLRISDLPIVTGNDLSMVTDDTLLEVSMKEEGFDSWKSKAMTYGDFKEQAVLCVAKCDFDFTGDKRFTDSLSVGGNISLSGSFVMNKDKTPAFNSEFYIKSNTNNLISLTDNTISAFENNNFYADNNRFFGKVEFHELTGTGDDPLITIDHGVIRTNKDIYCNQLHGVALSARWGDLAEYYIADNDYEPGTLIKFGGEKEVTVADDVVNGVITTKPGITINSELIFSEEKYVKGVALVGRVPVKVKGKVSKFDNIKLSDTNGVGVVATDSSDIVIGKALQNKETDELSSIECVVRLSF